MGLREKGHRVYPVLGAKEPKHDELAQGKLVQSEVSDDSAL